MKFSREMRCIFHLPFGLLGPCAACFIHHFSGSQYDDVQGIRVSGVLLSLFCVSQGTRVEKVINQLFEGFTINYIKCINIDFTSERKESFMDLQVCDNQCDT